MKSQEAQVQHEALTLLSHLCAVSHALLFHVSLLCAAMYKGQNLLELEPEERARSGLFMSFQSPVEVPGVSNAEFLRISANARRMAQGLPELDPLEFYGFITPKVRCMSYSALFAPCSFRCMMLQTAAEGAAPATLGSIQENPALTPNLEDWALTFACDVQLQSLNMDASFLDRNVNEGFSGTNRHQS